MCRFRNDILSKRWTENQPVCESPLTCICSVVFLTTDADRIANSTVSASAGYCLATCRHIRKIPRFAFLLCVGIRTAVLPKRVKCTVLSARFNEGKNMKEKIAKTNAARMLDKSKIAYRLVPYEVR